MPEPTMPVTAKTTEELVNKVQILFQEMYQDRVGGASLGDVFEIDSDDTLSLKVNSTGGLEKSGNEVQVKKKSGYGLESDADGLALKQQDHITDASDTTLVEAAAGADMIDMAALNVKFQTLQTEVNAIGSKVNEILEALEDAEILATS